MVTLSEIDKALAPFGLVTMGAFHPSDTTPGLSADTKTVVMTGPLGSEFWPLLQASPEYKDRAPDPIDRYSQRTVTTVAQGLGAGTAFPFGGPPHMPFFSWAIETGRAWSSPIMLLVHETAGLMASYRGALLFSDIIDLPPLPAKPCDTCTSKPCLTACPVSAISSAGYDVPKCKTFLETPEGQSCMTKGCAARMACPVSQSFGRPLDQSAHHMAYFHPKAVS